MNVSTSAMVSISEANQNFSKVTRMVDATGSVLIMKNNKPRYFLIDFDELEKASTGDLKAGPSFPEVEIVGQRILNRHRRAFEELAK